MASCCWLLNPRLPNAALKATNSAAMSGRKIVIVEKDTYDKIADGLMQISHVVMPYYIAICYCNPLGIPSERAGTATSTAQEVSVSHRRRYVKVASSLMTRQHDRRQGNHVDLLGEDGSQPAR